MKPDSTPKTQSVCKHCQHPIYYSRLVEKWAHFVADSSHEAEPVSEPASTGEPPPSAKEFWTEYYKSDPNFPPSEAACDFAEAYASRTFWKRWAEENTKIVKHWPGWKRIELAALRPYFPLPAKRRNRAAQNAKLRSVSTYLKS